MADNAYVNRRHFLKGAGAAIAGAPVSWSQGGAHPGVAIVVDPADPVASAAPVQWAARELQQALVDAGVAVSLHNRVAQADAGKFCIVASGPRTGHIATLAMPDAPGTQRLLLWGDPITAAAYSRAFSFCGSDGVEVMEQLSFKGRRGSGIAGDRCGYVETSLKPRLYPGFTPQLTNQPYLVVRQA